MITVMLKQRIVTVLAVALIVLSLVSVATGGDPFIVGTLVAITVLLFLAALVLADSMYEDAYAVDPESIRRDISQAEANLALALCALHDGRKTRVDPCEPHRREAGQLMRILRGDG